MFLSSKNIITKRPCKKLDNKKFGPFKVTAIVGSSYKLELPKTMRIFNVFHPKLLTLAATDPLPRQKNPPPPPTIVDSLSEWVVDDIIDSRRFGKRLKYQVKWEGFDEDLTWWNIDRGEFHNAQDVVDDFHKRYPEKER